MIDKLGITPGPWRIGFNNSIIGVFGGENGYDGWFDSPDDCDINLISAAPEMLEALINIGIYGALNHESDWRKVKPVIEKATGKTWEEIKELI